MAPPDDLRINGPRLLERLAAFAEIGPIDGGGSCRLALTDDDRKGRDLVVTWMRDLGLDVTIDAIGNVVAHRGDPDSAPVMAGSHIDTVRTGGRYDGNLGVLGGLDGIETVIESGYRPNGRWRSPSSRTRRERASLRTCSGRSPMSAGWPSKRRSTSPASTARRRVPSCNGSATSA